MAKKVLISAFIGSNNLGDEAIFRSILENLHLNKSMVTATTLDEAKTQRFGVKTVPAKNPVSLYRAISQNDILLIGGGGIIQDKTSIFNFLYYFFQVLSAKLRKTPVVLCFVGVGPLKHSLSKWLLMWMVKYITFAVVRDDVSEQELLSANMDKRKIFKAYDPALNLKIDSTQLEGDAKKPPYFVLSLRRWFFATPLLPVFMSRRLNKLPGFGKRYKNFIETIAKDVDIYLDKNKNMGVVAAPFYKGEDDIVLNDFVSALKNKNKVSLIDADDMTEERYLSLVGGSEFILGMRLHSLILGSTVAKPFVALEYSSKVGEFTRQFGLDELAVHVENLDSAKIQNSLEKINKNKAEYAENILFNLQEYKSTNDKAFLRIRKIIDDA